MRDESETVLSAVEYRSSVRTLLHSPFKLLVARDRVLCHHVYSRTVPKVRVCSFLFLNTNIIIEQCIFYTKLEILHCISLFNKIHLSGHFVKISAISVFSACFVFIFGSFVGEGLAFYTYFFEKKKTRKNQPNMNCQIF